MGFLVAVSDATAGTGGADWYARVAAGLGIAISLVTLMFSWRAKLWARRHAAVEHLELRDTVLEVQQSLFAAKNDHRNVRTLWVTTFNVRLEKMTSDIQQIPDRKLGGKLLELERLTVTARGTQPTVATDANGLTPKQGGALDAANIVVGQVQRRIDKIANKGRA